jgi:succinoglycan biosynthesis transport protein ExoP
MNNDITIPELLMILRRRSRIIAIVAAACFLGALLICLFSTRRYEAIGEIQVQKSSSDGLGLENMMSAADSASDALDANITLQTQANILQSDTLALRVIENLNLEHTKDFQRRSNPLGWALGVISPGGPRDRSNAALADAPGRRTHVLKVFTRNLKVKPVAGTRLIDISYMSSDPSTAAAVVNQLTQSLAEYSFQTRYNATNQAAGWLGGQLADLKKQAEASQTKVVQLQRESGVFSLGLVDGAGKEESYSATLDRLQQATAALTAATSNRIIKGGIYEMVKHGNPELISGLAGSSLSGASPAVNNSFNLLQNLRGQQATLESQMAMDTSKFGTANPKLADERSSLASLSEAIKQEVERIGERAANDFRSSQVAEAGLSGVYDQQRREANKLNDKAIEYMIARQEAVDSRQLYETLNQHLKAAGVMEGLQSSNITIVDPARVPSKPVKPNVPVYLALSLFGGVFLGTFGALFVEAMDDRIQSMEMVEQALHTSILAVLPMVQVASPKSVSGYLTGKHPPKQLTQGDGATILGRLAVLEGPNSAFVEALRGLRTALLLSRSGSPPKVILITSAAEGEGKSTICVNLAAIFAQNGSRVLLVEADMRRPGLSLRLRIDHKARTGLSSLLSGNGEEPQIHPYAELPNLTVLPAGPIPPYPSELLGAKRMKELVEQWSADYDFVLIDSPPILAVTDAKILSSLADMTLLVTRHGVSTRKSLERAYKSFDQNSSGRPSVVLNGISRDSTSYGEYYGYKGSSYYSEA